MPENKNPRLATYVKKPHVPQVTPNVLPDQAPGAGTKPEQPKSPADQTYELIEKLEKELKNNKLRDSDRRYKEAQLSSLKIVNPGYHKGYED